MAQCFEQLLNRFSNIAARSSPLQGCFLVLTSFLVVVAAQPLYSQTQPPLPSPAAAAQQAARMTPQEIVAVTIDEATRDRLRFDPAWRSMYRSIQQDIMILKWGDGRLENPVWKQYGAKAYPLLDYYARSADETRRTYGIVGIRKLGKPYSTLWLEKQLQQNRSFESFYMIQADPNTLLNNEYNNPYYDSKDWEREFGLDDVGTSDRLLQIARAHLKPATDPNYYSQFNLAFVQALTTGNYWSAPSPPALPNPFYDPDLREWNQLSQVRQLTATQTARALPIYRSLKPTTQQYLLVRLGNVRAGQATPIALALFRQLAADAQEPDRVWAIAELDRHGTAQGSRTLQQILNGNDLSQLNSLTRSVRYETGDISNLPGALNTHAYYLLVGMTQKYPQSRFIRAARAYGDLTGRSYFGGASRPQAMVDRLAQQTPAQRQILWQNWLSLYPDHPGADDATYFLARSLQDQNQVMPAIDLWIKLMTRSIGDGDATYLAYPQLRTMLDVGLTTEQITSLIQRYANQPIAPLFRYALAVRQARSQNYARAIQTSQGLDLSKMDDRVLGSYYHEIGWYGRGNVNSTVAMQQDMQTMLVEQRQRWQHLQQLQATNTPSSRYELASNWAGENGWKNGYLAVWDNFRVEFLPTGDWSNYYCKIYWVCSASRSTDAIRSSYQQSSQNAIALGLYQSLLDSSQPAPLREKTLYMAAYTLLGQWEDYPLGETLIIHPPATVTAGSVRRFTDDYEQRSANLAQIQKDYQASLDRTIATLKQEFPQSQYIDDLLFSRYAMSGDRQYLQQIVSGYSAGDRAAAAQFLLAHPKPDVLQ